MDFLRMPIEEESPEEYGYDRIECNLSESSVTDLRLEELTLNLKDLVLFYGEHSGEKGLRAAIAALYDGVEPEDVLVTTGAAAALFIVHISLLNPGSRLLVAFPNYGTNLETPRGMGVNLTTLPLTFEGGFQPDLKLLRAALEEGQELVSLTNPHNPSGAVFDQSVLSEVVQEVVKHGSLLLVDETYRDLGDASHHPLAATLHPSVISVSSLSKAYGLPGIRVGWIVCKNKSLMHRFLAAKEQIFVCNSVLDEAVALQFLNTRGPIRERIQANIRRNRSVLYGWMENNPWLEWVEPQGGVVCFPRFKEGRIPDLTRFYALLKERYHTFVGPGHWFGLSDRYMRIGFGWPTTEALQEGLRRIARAAEDSFGG